MSKVSWPFKVPLWRDVVGKDSRGIQADDWQVVMQARPTLYMEALIIQ